MRKKIIDIDTLKYLGKAVIIALLVIFVFRCFVFQTFTISTSQMESALIKGDEVLVSKLSYGPRLPITPLNIPFTFDKFLGVKSYSNLITLPYMRFFSAGILPNDIVLFNSPLETDKPLDKRSLLISRCVALPGDTIIISDGMYYINNKEYVQSPTLVSEYTVPIANYNQIVDLANELNISLKKIETNTDSVYFTLDRYDAFVLNSNTTAGTFYKMQSVIPETLVFIAPSKGRGCVLTPNNVKIYRQVIEYEQGEKVEFKGNDVYIGNKKIENYYFNDDYYWMLSDNSVDAIDSRSIGFIPYKNIIGRAVSVVYSSDDQGVRWDRVLFPAQ